MEELKVGTAVKYNVGKGVGEGVVVDVSPVQVAIRTPGGKYVCRHPDVVKVAEKTELQAQESAA